VSIPQTTNSLGASLITTKRQFCLITGGGGTVGNSVSKYFIENNITVVIASRQVGSLSKNTHHSVIEFDASNAVVVLKTFKALLAENHLAYIVQSAAAFDDATLQYTS